MSHSVCQVREVEIVSAYTLRISFDDGAGQTINFRPVLAGRLYCPLRDLEAVNRVRVDPEVHTLVWPSGADFDPAANHDGRPTSRRFAARCNAGGKLKVGPRATPTEMAHPPARN